MRSRSETAETQKKTGSWVPTPTGWTQECDGAVDCTPPGVFICSACSSFLGDLLVALEQLFWMIFGGFQSSASDCFGDTTPIVLELATRFVLFDSLVHNLHGKHTTDLI